MLGTLAAFPLDDATKSEIGIYLYVDREPQFVLFSGFKGPEHCLVYIKQIALADT